ncbi:MAG: hypothetical protein F6K26_32630 [Moorea sp. SIO2I5]|nr:hypothetical protein [Moorena sp. SIO2I5]
MTYSHTVIFDERVGGIAIPWLQLPVNGYSVRMSRHFTITRLAGFWRGNGSPT